MVTLAAPGAGDQYKIWIDLAARFVRFA